jgi:hypothetical protein
MVTIKIQIRHLAKLAHLECIVIILKAYSLYRAQIKLNALVETLMIHHAIRVLILTQIPNSAFSVHLESTV